MPLHNSHTHTQIQINQLKAEKFEMKSHISKLEDEVRILKGIVSHFLNMGHAQTVNANQQSYNNSQMMPSNVIADRNVLRSNSSINRASVSPSDSQKRQNANFPLKYGTINSDSTDATDQMHLMQQQFNELLKDDHSNFNHFNNNSSGSTTTNAMNQQQQPNQQYPNDVDVYTDATTENHECTIVQMEKDNLELRRELQDARASNKQADKKIQE